VHVLGDLPVAALAAQGGLDIRGAERSFSPMM